MSLRPTTLPEDVDMEEALSGAPDLELSRMFMAQSLGQTAATVAETLPVDPNES